MKLALDDDTKQYWEAVLSASALRINMVAVIARLHGGDGADEVADRLTLISTELQMLLPDPV